MKVLTRHNGIRLICEQDKVDLGVPEDIPPVLVVAFDPKAKTSRRYAFCKMTCLVNWAKELSGA